MSEMEPSEIKDRLLFNLSSDEMKTDVHSMLGDEDIEILIKESDKKGFFDFLKKMTEKLSSNVEVESTDVISRATVITIQLHKLFGEYGIWVDYAGNKDKIKAPVLTHPLDSGPEPGRAIIRIKNVETGQLVSTYEIPLDKYEELRTAVSRIRYGPFSVEATLSEDGEVVNANLGCLADEILVVVESILANEVLEATQT